MHGHSTEYELSVLHSMVEKLQEYLDDDRLFKTISAYTPQGERLLKMSLGSIFRHISELRTAPLTSEQRAAFDGLTQQVEQIQRNRSDLFHTKLGRELKSYTDSWQWFLQNCWEGERKCVADYPQEVDLRLRVDHLLKLGGNHPALSNERRRVAELDQKLRAQWAPGAFLLDEAARNKYPADEYWWLYGHPTVGSR